MGFKIENFPTLEGQVVLNYFFVVASYIRKKRDNINFKKKENTSCKFENRMNNMRKRNLHPD